MKIGDTMRLIGPSNLRVELLSEPYTIPGVPDLFVEVRILDVTYGSGALGRVTIPPHNVTTFADDLRPL